MAISPNTDFSAGAVLTSAQQNRFPRGVMGYSARVSSFSVTTTATDVGASVTFTAVANRYYKYTAYCYACDTSGSVNVTLDITNSSNVSQNAVIQRVQGPTQFQFLLNTYVTTETAGTVTRKLRAYTSSGSGVMYAPIWLLVEDIGPA